MHSAAPAPRPAPPPLVQLSPRLDIPADLSKALTLLSRSSAVRDFLLDPSSPESDVRLLTSPRPAFTLLTEEEQRGALPGRIALRYLGVPAFAQPGGLSGGAVVTSYAARTHPLHAPAVMADVRVGRYVRDDATGEWCFITRNRRDNLTRLQYVRVSDRVRRERICLTCNTDLFDKGHFLRSVLFQCHDNELRACPVCAAPPSIGCRCPAPPRPAPRRPVPPGLAGAAGAVMREGPANWVGRVRVTVVSNLSKNSLLNIDECMDVTASYHPTMDSALAADMQRLAIFEKASDGTTIPAPMAPLAGTPHRRHLRPSPRPKALQQPKGRTDTDDNDDYYQDTPSKSQKVNLPAMTAPRDVLSPEEMIRMTPDEKLAPALHAVHVGDSEPPSAATNPTKEFFDEEAFGPEPEIFANPFLHVPRYDFAEFLESAMLPADPSTLPGGIELCMDGMDLEDDWSSSISYERDSGSSASGCTASSSASNYTADQLVPQPNLTRGQDQNLHTESEQLYQKNSHAQLQQQTMQSHLPPAPIEETIMPMEAEFHHQQQPLVEELQKLPQPMQQPSAAPIATPPVVPKEEAELVVDATEQKPQLFGRGVALAPRPAGMAACADGFIWQMGSAPGNPYLLAARLEAIEKERKAEERRKKNRQAAARSNARKKNIMDGFRADIKQGQARIAELRKLEDSLKQENLELKRQMDLSD